MARIISVLVACEESQKVCCAFRALGHEAYSCDLVPCSGGHPEWHIQDDALEVMQARHWDLLIAHPPCTYLSNAGACRLYPRRGCAPDPERLMQGMLARDFFMEFLETRFSRHVCVENPTPSRVFGLPSPDCVIQPYEFGHPYTKRTCLWLRNLPPLTPTRIVTPIAPFCPSGTGRRDRSKYGVAARGNDRRNRSVTFDGIAAAMAEQWSTFITREREGAE